MKRKRYKICKREWSVSFSDRERFREKCIESVRYLPVCVFVSSSHVFIVFVHFFVFHFFHFNLFSRPDSCVSGKGRFPFKKISFCSKPEKKLNKPGNFRVKIWRWVCQISPCSFPPLFEPKLFFAEQTLISLKQEWCYDKNIRFWK